MRSSTSGTRAEAVADVAPRVGDGRGAALPTPQSSDAASAEPVSDPRIARLFEMTSDLLATISLDGRFTLLNPAWERALGWTREELQSRPVADFVHPDDAAQLR